MKLLTTTHKIKQSLISLCRIIPIEKITVKKLIEFTSISRATFYKYYTNLTEVWQQITQDVLFEMSVLKKEPYIEFSFSDIQLLEQLAQYIHNRQFVIQMLLSKNGDPEFLEKWEQQMKHIILTYLNDKNSYDIQKREEMSEFLAIGTVHKIIKAIYSNNPEHLLSILITTQDILFSFSNEKRCDYHYKKDGQEQRY